MTRWDISDWLLVMWVCYGAACAAFLVAVVLILRADRRLQRQIDQINWEFN